MKKTVVVLLLLATLAVSAGCSAQSSAAPQTRSDATTSATPQASGPVDFNAPTFQT